VYHIGYCGGGDGGFPTCRADAQAPVVQGQPLVSDLTHRCFEFDAFISLI
jgi:hypothetical protein